MSQTEFMEFPKLSRKEISILEMLINHGEMYGLEMVEASVGELKRGTIYVTLQRMSDKGFVTSREEARPHPEIGIARRKYSISGLGQRVYRANAKAKEYFNLELGWEV